MRIHFWISKKAGYMLIQKKNLRNGIIRYIEMEISPQLPDHLRKRLSEEILHWISHRLQEYKDSIDLQEMDIYRELNATGFVFINLPVAGDVIITTDDLIEFLSLL